MSEPIPLPEFVDNPESRCPVVLLVDTSSSMAGAKLEALNKGIRAFREAVMKDDLAAMRVEVAIVGFGPVRLIQDFVTMAEFQPPALMASGTTPLGEAIEHGIELVSKRKAVYRAHGIPYYRPWIFLITDGAPSDPDRCRTVAPRLHERERERKQSFFAVGVEGADMQLLAQLAPPERPPLRLDGLNFGALFQWLSASVVRVSTGIVGSELIALPPITWGKPHA